MRKILLIIVMLLLTGSSLFAQRMSPLFQVMSSNSLIDRPQVFKDLQDNIETVTKKTKPGLHVDVLYKRMAQFRKNILKHLAMLDVKYEQNVFTIKYKSKPYIEIDYKTSNSINIKLYNIYEEKNYINFLIIYSKTGLTIQYKHNKCSFQYDTPITISYDPSKTEYNISINGTTIIIPSENNHFGISTVTFKIEDLNKSVQDIQDSVKILLKKNININFTASSWLEKAFKFAMQNSFIEICELSSSYKSDKNSFSDFLIDIIVDMIFNKIDDALFDNFENYQKVKKIADYLFTEKSELFVRERICSFLDISARNVSSMQSKISRKLSESMDAAEAEVNKAVNTANNWLLSANTGFGITEGEGAFDGGIYISWMHKNISIGAYYNGEISGLDSSEQSKQPIQSLIGLNFKYAPNPVEFEFLVSYLLRDKNFPNNTSIEYGLGIKWNIGNLIIGAGYCRQNLSTDKQDVYEAVESLGLILGSPVLNHPQIIVGAARDIQSDSWKPTIKLSYPITGYN